MKEYSPELSEIYEQYLGNNPFLQNCSQQRGSISDITESDIRVAIDNAKRGVEIQEQIDRQLISMNPRLGNFSHFLYEANLKTKFNEIMSQTLAQM